MAGALDVVVRFIGDASSIQNEAAKVEGVGGRLKTWAKGVGVAIGAAFAVREIKDWVAAAEESERASARLAKTLKNAGDATGRWTRDAEKLATTLMRKTGIDDEVIKGSQAILATFHAVSDQTGQQAGIFDRATKAAADLSKAGFGDMDSAAKQLGKALQDPEKGLSALRRAGVDFTQAQKDQITALVQSGDQLGAMKIILGEVENQVGGVAEKTATSGDRMRAAWRETQESLGQALLPVLQALAPILQKIAVFVQQNATWLVPLAAAIIGVVAAIKLWIAVQTVIDALLAANPIGAIVLGIAALIAIIVLLVTKWDEIWNWIANAPWYVKVAFLILAIINPIVQVIAIVKLFLTYWDDVWRAVVDAVNAAVNWIKAAFNDVMAFIGGIPGRVAGLLADIFWIVTAPFRLAVDGVRSLVGDIVGFFSELPGRIVGAIGNIGGRLFNIGRNMMEDLLDGIKSMAGSVIEKAKEIGQKVVDFINPLGSPKTIAFYAGQNMMRDYAAGAASQTRAVAQAMAGIGGAVSPAATFTSGGGRAPVQFTIHVNVPVGAAPAAVGAATVDAIRSYERVAGKAWRTS